ncbi:hypothetical protein [Gluconacetobacter entanii]|uniref:hypothetical protein n=1 Tax=Gluconacetobacter entanii TaxID=108528 RepID=UPI0011B75836|nr:hypothetical protein [Gluconacetobacter entanii]MCE2578084.1 hypothetical protein [Komagataeibacter sp. FNDCR1]
MSLKLLGVRRAGENLETGHAELTVALAGNDGETPWSGTLTLQIPDQELVLHKSFEVKTLAERALLQVLTTYQLTAGTKTPPKVE